MEVCEKDKFEICFYSLSFESTDILYMTQGIIA